MNQQSRHVAVLLLGGVAGLPAAVDRLLVRRIRPTCRWWRQEGAAAYHRCPRIVTETVNPSEQLRHATDPTIYAESMPLHHRPGHELPRPDRRRSCGSRNTLTFTFGLFYDNLSYPSSRNYPSSTWR